MESAAPTFSGYRRQRKTRLSVRMGEVGSRMMITFGGIGTIIAIVLVCVFLVWVAVPLFMGSKTELVSQHGISWSGQPVRVGFDNDQILGWALQQDGTLVSFQAKTGEKLEVKPLFTGATITCISPPSRHSQVVVGFADGSVRLGKIEVTSQLLDESKQPSEIKSLQPRTGVKHGSGLVYRHENGALNAYQLNATFDPPEVLASGQAIQAADITMRSTGPVVCSLSADGVLRVSDVQETKNLITGKVKRELSGGELKLVARPEGKLPEYALVNGVGDNVFLVWKDGFLQRINAKKVEEPKVVEEVKLTDGATVNAVQFMIGKTTLLVGDSTGKVKAWFATKPKGFKENDGSRLEAAHELLPSATPVRSLASSSRSRLLAANYADGSIRLIYLTNEKELAVLPSPAGLSAEQVMLAPNEDGVFAWDQKGIANWSLKVGHPEVSFRSLFLPVWYEGAAKPEYVWQSSSGDDAFEPKLSLVPLIFGTLKATFYSLLIGVPLALCAAIYSREFLHPKIRSVVKPTIEVMASLPSVVLGFIGAFVIAPFVGGNLVSFIFGIVIVPAGFALAGFLWHTLPQKWTRTLQPTRFIFISLVLPCVIALAVLLSPVLEKLLFEGDLKHWLSHPGNNSRNGWLLLLLPLATVVTILLLASVVNPWIRRVSRTVSSSREAFLNLAKFLGSVLFTLVIAWLGAVILGSLGFDPRNSFFGAYDQNNALVVGVMMGFAIIPIIFTLAEEALTSVPDHLRSASLGCGATTWQTASRIVLPTAMGGIFSAVMVGLGRAVGETMVVLMVAGNVPVLDLNLFNGFRTLSANIAVELPEAVQGGTQYRTLFLAALTLFVFTFALNTFAESMRQRFRKRAFEL